MQACGREQKMKRRSFAILVALLLSAYIYAPALAATNGEEDTDARLVDARVVEVNDQHISVVAQTGVEHVIATDAAKTRVTLKGKRIAFKKLKVGDIVTVELDALNPLKFARRIVVGEQAGGTLASVRD
jgi:hypothetical protein